MFSRELKEWIQDNVRDVYRGDIKKDIECFEKGLSLCAPEEDLEGVHDILPEVLEEMSQAPSLKQLAGYMERFVKIEPYLRHLFGVLYPTRYQRRPMDEPAGLPFTEWTFAALLKQAFLIIPVQYNLSNRTPANTVFPYKECYDLVYDKRNDSAHNFSKMGQKEVLKLIEAFLVVYLDVSGRLCIQIGKAYDREAVSMGFSAADYCQRIVREHKNEIKQGFTYIDVKWRSSAHSDMEYSTVDSMVNDRKNRLIKILGEAGCGKTTFMRQIEFLIAQKYVRNSSTVIPVYVPLIHIEIDSSLRADIRTILCRQLGIDMELLNSMFQDNRIILLLDGFNEILDIKTKRKIAWSIDELVREYEELNIFLSDRSLVRAQVDVMNGAVSYRLYPLDNCLKEAFIINNCLDPDAKKLLLDYFQENPNLYENYNTPIRIMQLIELVCAEKRLPEDFDREYIHYLFEREFVEKKDENVSYLEDFACALAITSDNGVPLRVACASLAKCKNVLGYTVPDSLQCLNLLIEMGILTNEEGIIDFKFPSYREYFWMNAFENHLVDLLGDD